MASRGARRARRRLARAVRGRPRPHPDLRTGTAALEVRGRPRPHPDLRTGTAARAVRGRPRPHPDLCTGTAARGVRGRPRPHLNLGTGTAARGVRGRPSSASGPVHRNCGRGRPRTSQTRTGASPYPGDGGVRVPGRNAHRGVPRTVGALEDARRGRGGAAGFRGRCSLGLRAGVGFDWRARGTVQALPPRRCPPSAG